MKVVVSCGGLGTRLREHLETIPKLWCRTSREFEVSRGDASH